jgi:hypothetical protein
LLHGSLQGLGGSCGHHYDLGIGVGKLLGTVQKSAQSSVSIQGSGMVIDDLFLSLAARMCPIGRNSKTKTHDLPRLPCRQRTVKGIIGLSGVDSADWKYKFKKRPIF